MNETDKLRSMLTVRGIDHTDLYTAFGSDQITQWPTKDLLQATATEHEQDGTLLVTFYGSAEQAIEGTLGKGECHDKNGRNRLMGFKCTVCGAMCSDCDMHDLSDGFVHFRYCPSCGRKVRA